MRETNIDVEICWDAVGPELHRVQALRGALRLVSTAACREVRAERDTRYDTVDHVMTYLFADRGGFGSFRAAAGALAAGRRP